MTWEVVDPLKVKITRLEAECLLKMTGEPDFAPKLKGRSLGQVCTSLKSKGLMNWHRGPKTRVPLYSLTSEGITRKEILEAEGLEPLPEIPPILEFEDVHSRWDFNEDLSFIEATAGGRWKTKQDALSALLEELKKQRLVLASKIRRTQVNLDWCRKGGNRAQR